MKSIVTLAAVLFFGWGAMAQDLGIDVSLELNCDVAQPCLYEEALGVCVDQVNVSVDENGVGFFTVFQRYQNARGIEVVPIFRTFEQDRSILFDTKQYDSLSDTWLVIWGRDYADTASTLNFRGIAFNEVFCSIF